MTSIPIDQDELQAAAHASLRAHPISEAAQALVSELTGTVNAHALATGARKNKRKSTSDKLEYVRIFHNGDDPQFFWNMGGRLYSQHFAESYQVMNADNDHCEPRACEHDAKGGEHHE